MTFESFLKVQYLQNKHDETSMKLRWNFDETSKKLRWNFDETSMKLRWNFGETSMKLRWNFDETSMKLRWNFGETLAVNSVCSLCLFTRHSMNFYDCPRVFTNFSFVLRSSATSPPVLVNCVLYRMIFADLMFINKFFSNWNTSESSNNEAFQFVLSIQ